MLQSIYTHAGCDYGCLYTYSPRHCFNPHTHAGCDTPPASAKADSNVSIHTPTQGVTEVKCFTSESKIVSIHTPTQGVTISKYMLCKTWIVSIHTPTQGVTSSYLDKVRLYGFNPHTHAGCDYSHLPNVYIPF